MKEKLLSVIIPVYNVEKYLKKCVDSVINQTYRNLQIVLIDDGSTDTSGKLCDEFAKADKRIEVIHKVNEGQAKARNVGLDLAQGDYIAFLDSDDYIASEMYFDLIKTLEENEADIASCAIQYVDEQGDFLGGQKYSGEVSILSRLEVVEDLYKQAKVRFEVWNKVFRREILENVRFIEGQLHEEVGFCRMAYLKINKYSFLDKPLHFYLCKRSGNTNSYFSKKKLCIFNEFDKFIVDIQAVGLPVRVAEKFEALKIHFCMNLTVAAKRHHASKEVKRFLKELYITLKRNNKKNPYIPRCAMLIFSVSPMLYFFFLALRDKLKGN